ncbi:hypothetical protein ACFL3C_00325 [Patescibacteria group bacterium]
MGWMHKDYEEDNVGINSLAFIGEDELIHMTSGMVRPGDWDCGMAASQETIVVTSGMLSVNGKQFVSGDMEPCVIQPGEHIQIKADELSTYLCYYDPPLTPKEE